MTPPSRGSGPPAGAGIGALAGAEQIYVIPFAWRDAPWWSPAQEENLRAILDTVKRTYNVDENRVVLAGVSDGATAAYYFAMRDTTPVLMFARRKAWDRVDLVRSGTTVEARTQGVARFTLLLSPDVFDFSQPIKIVAKGRVAFDGRVERSVATLLKWAARDNDRTMLFGAERPVTID